MKDNRALEVLYLIKANRFYDAAEKHIRFRIDELADKEAVADIAQRMETKWKKLHPLKLSDGYTLDDIAKEVLDSIENEFKFS